MRETFEQAILENPDEKAGYASYADWLQEQGDPRGEFIAVQLALEDESRPPEERTKLRIRERELLNAHERPWLGELAPYLLDREAYNEYVSSSPECLWRNGFLSSVSVPVLTMRSAQLLATIPPAKFLRELRVGNSAGHYDLEEVEPPAPRIPTPEGINRHWELLELIGAPCLRNLRVFQMGDEEPHEDGWCDSHCYAGGLEHVIASMPRIEELHLLCKEYEIGALFALPNLTHLRVLRAYHLGGFARERRYEYPLDVLATNPALGTLTHLLFHPHQSEEGDDDGSDRSYLPLDQVRALVFSKHLKSLTHLQLRLSDMGDDGVREIVNSGILKQLKWLDLRHGCITDNGARLFADCPDSRNLERLDLTRNAVTIAGLNLLRGAGVPAVANHPLTEQELADREYLREGDFE